eukprot:136145_1
MGKCVSIPSEHQTNSYSNNCYSVGACSINGQATKTENSYSICLSFPNHTSYSFFAVIQGFNGKHAAQYLANNLLNRLNQLETLDDDKIVINTINKMDDEFLDLKNAKINNSGCTFVFALIHHPNNNLSLQSHSTSSSRSIQSSTLQHLSTQSITSFSAENTLCNHSSNSSSTSEIAPLKLPDQNYKCRIFWVGDCRGVIIKKHGKRFESLTNDHCTQIGNKTKLSRCFGYYTMKNNKNKYGQKKMKCITECKRVSIRRKQTLILFSNGLTKHWYDNQMVKYYNNIYQKHKNTNERMTNSLQCLLKKCKDDGSNQNMSALSIKLRH